MSLFYAYKSRGITKDITVTNAAGSAIAPGSNDKLRAIICRISGLSASLDEAELVVTSDAPTANGSSFTKGGGSGGSNRLRLDAGDLDFVSGSYTLIIDYFDNADSGEWKNVSRQVFYLEDT